MFLRVIDLQKSNAKCFIDFSVKGVMKCGVKFVLNFPSAELSGLSRFCLLSESKSCTISSRQKRHDKQKIHRNFILHGIGADCYRVFLNLWFAKPMVWVRVAFHENNGNHENDENDEDNS